MAAFAAVVGLGLLVVGMYLGWAPVHREYWYCGTAFGGVDRVAVTDTEQELDMRRAVDARANIPPAGVLRAACETAVAHRQPRAVAALVVGGLLVNVAGIGFYGFYRRTDAHTVSW